MKPPYINEDLPAPGTHMEAGARALYLTWIAELAHEINNPNNVANASAQRLDYRLKELQLFIDGMLADDVDSEIKRAFEQRFKSIYAQTQLIQAGCQRVAGIILNMHEQAKGEQFECSAVDPASLLHNACRLVAAMDESNVALDTSALLPMGESIANADRLGQVFFNLLINACHAIQKKRQDQPGTEGLIQCYSQRRDNGVELVIRDNGCGMSDAVKARLFDRYFTTKTDGKGTGLGMGISKAIIEEHGGRIEVASEEGVGTTVLMWLPLAS